MALETATYISQLVPANPTHADGVNQGDAHERLIKSVLQNQFPNLGAAAVTGTAAQLNTLLTLLNSSGAVANQGLTTAIVPMGTIHMFPAVPTTSGFFATGGTATGTEQFIEMDGSSYASSKFPALAASPFVTVSGSNFTVPTLTDTGRFLRSRSTAESIVVGTSQANQNAAHTHGTSALSAVSAGSHTHTASSTDSGHTHPPAPGANDFAAFVASGGAYAVAAGSNIAVPNATGTGTANISTTITAAGAHTHTISGSTDSSGGAEARPEAFAVVMCIKT